MAVSVRRILYALSLTACSSSAATGPATTTSVTASSSEPAATTPAVSVRVPGANRCGLSAPVKSDDACGADAECGPSDPCHAHACIAAAKAKPRGAQTMCTEIMDCGSTDANDCKCLEGRCALVPRR